MNGGRAVFGQQNSFVKAPLLLLCFIRIEEAQDENTKHEEEDQGAHRVSVRACGLKRQRDDQGA